MNNQLILKEDVSLFDKVRAFFKGIFSKKNKKVKEEVYAVNNEQKVENKSNVKQKNTEKNEYISYIESNPDVIESFTDDRLDSLIRYYKKIISLKKMKLNKLKENRN